ncbi:hypothetical protein NNJEOMEG_03615 [Fundidesulfovibrio magnetotacticus]|uniref:DUF2147 domain-containing protein n=1 Tax=Fundidesulfovibrio magnetotacticus TaxID=2730080 RepID=A0A6V8M1M6_9BACT|nr:hypothetical protein [Fundidesulfovibrio magnetotacticus]GFK95747.1 hypothetical protein NNJEOMEG_03615 [Fundidesulfovibrio magnetotacticus]
MKTICLAVALLLALPALAAPQPQNVEGLWTADFFGNTVECHLEQKGQFLWGVAYVTTRAGERNTYHLIGIVAGNSVEAFHGSSGNRFSGQVSPEGRVSGNFIMKDGPTIAMDARRVKPGRTHPGGLEWPPNYPPAQ